MAKPTLLDIVQDLLSSMDSDEVNSIQDTVEAMDVARIVKGCYRDITAGSNLPEHFDIFELEPSNDPTQPTLMYMPSNATSLLWVKYDRRMYGDVNSDFYRVDYLRPEDFIDRMHGLTNGTDVEAFDLVVGSDTFEIKCFNNKNPNYYTCWDDNMVVFDSYDATVDTTLQKSKTMAYGEKSNSFQLIDSYVPDLDEKQFSLLINEAKAMAFAEKKQMAHDLAIRNAKRGWITLANQKHRTPAKPSFFKSTPNYGRK